MMKIAVVTAAFALAGAAAQADSTWAKAKSDTFKGGPNSAHGVSYGTINKLINDTIRTEGSYTSVHSGTEYTKPGAGNRK